MRFSVLAQHKCVPGENFKIDCNNCFCQSICRPEPGCDEPAPVVESCTDGETTKISCYNCTCLIGCTLMRCPPKRNPV